MMMSEATATVLPLVAQERDATQNPRQLRAAGWVPATLYSKGQPSRNLQVEAKAFTHAIGKGTDTFLLEGLKLKVVVQQVQLHSLSQQVLNVEFMPAS
jgi:ribosomal protein L25 (general stress protein Ctc)